MSNLRTRSEHEALGGSPWSDFDSEYRCVRKTSQSLKQETPVETPLVDETEQGVDDEAPSLEFPKRPKCVSLAVIAGNAVYESWEDGRNQGREEGYKLGFSAGRLAGLEEAQRIMRKPYIIPELTHDPGDKPF